jgi:serine/threonine protein kinase
MLQICRDLKPENILLESTDINNFDLKITDFGFACFFEQKGGLDDVLGSPLYMAPEIVRQRKYDSKVDVWSIGVITYVLLSGRPPFFGQGKDAIFESILN